MGKKVKKDEKPPPDDVFDPLLVESRQAVTVVLMLNSPEEEVQSKACEAIYRYVEKCDENKKLLLDLNAVDPLLKLVNSEDRTVRRHACMALGVLCAHADVRRALRKREEAIPAFIGLLSPEEEAVVHEFAALALSYLATEYTSKITIFENNGLEPLIRCLSSHDPDVQKNATEALAQLMLDYQSRSAFHELEGFPPVMELLKSDYAIIQKLALLTLERASLDASNRAALRELDAITRLMDVLAKPEWNDLHVMVVMVLTNLLEDKESLEQIKESGGLKRLVSIITDQPPSEDDGKKADKKASSRAGKKSGKDSEGKDAAKKRGGEEEKDESQLAGDTIIPTLPDVKASAAKAIARAAKNDENRKILHDQETEKMLILLLTHESPDVQAAAANALAEMCNSPSSRDSVREWEGLPALVKLLNSESADVREMVTLALANLTTANHTNCQEVGNLGGIDPLVSILGDTREEAVANSACTLTNLAQDEGLRTEAKNRGVVPALIEPLRSSNTSVQSQAALSASAFVCDADSRLEFRENGGLEPLINMLQSGSEAVRRNASWALTVCAVDEPTATEICKLGGLQLLQEIQLSSSRRSPFTDAALERLLDSNLSAKYALTGKLEFNNIIENGFFDVGQLKVGTKFMTLEDYCKQEVNDKRPIYLVNAKTQEEEAPQPENPVQMKPEESESKSADMSKSSLGPKPSRTARDAKSPTKSASKQKSKKEREKEEKQKEEELIAQKEREAEIQAQAMNKPFTPPCDPMMVKYIDEVTIRIQPLPSSRQQIPALAQFVAEKMGGPIEKGQVINFSWELPLSQIKYDSRTNVIPIGRIRFGIHTHRALLFKALADRIALGCSLTRGEYNRAWNIVMLGDEEDDTPGAPKFPPKPYIVDLIHEPGRLLPLDSPDAVNYQKI